MFLIHEAYPHITPEGLVRMPWNAKDDYVELPPGPGLGVEVDEDKVAKYHAAYRKHGDYRTYSDKLVVPLSGKAKSKRK
jgi:hypothetical protein